jgi:hypothetical protein
MRMRGSLHLSARCRWRIASRAAKTPHRTATAVIQPGLHRYCRQVSVRDEEMRGVRSVDISQVRTCRGTGIARVSMPRSASDTSHDSGTASDTH